MQYSPGDYFGELALLNASVGTRAATVKTNSAARLLTIKRDAFKRMLGSLEQILLERSGQYT
jgi:CRP-like cAMP-binding protein